MPGAFAQAGQAIILSRADRLLSEAEFLYDKARAVIDRSEEKLDGQEELALLLWPEELSETIDRVADARRRADDMVLKAIREARPALELLARITGQLQGDQTNINIHLAPDFQDLQKTLLDALSAYPEAWLAVADAMAAFVERQDPARSRVITEGD